MEVDPRIWPHGNVGMDHMRERPAYPEGDQGNWGGAGIDMSKHGAYYSRGMDYSVNQVDRPTYYTDHPMAPEMGSCDPSMYGSGQMMPMAPPHGMYETLPHQHYPNASSSEMEHWHLQMLSQTDPFLALPIRDGHSKRKRRRVISHEQRKAANIRERRRMYQLNEAFDGLRKRVPTFAYEKKLSRIETLKLAVTYIEFMAEILENNGEKCTEMLKKVKDKLKDFAEEDSNSASGDDANSEQGSGQKAINKNSSVNEEDCIDSEDSLTEES